MTTARRRCARCAAEKKAARLDGKDRPDAWTAMKQALESLPLPWRRPGLVHTE